jgi:hypothetical protein
MNKTISHLHMYQLILLYKEDTTFREVQNSEMFIQFFKISSRKLPNDQIIIKVQQKIKTYLDS